MKINYKDTYLNVHVDELSLSSDKTPIVFLHGFTGNGKDWKSIADKFDNIFLPVAPDIIGHGTSDSPENIEYYNEDSQVDQLNTIFDNLALSKLILCGYSMGGRLAICYAHKYPEKVQGLILESCTPGIENERDREQRILNDLVLARKIREDGIESFIEYWMSIPLFKSLEKLSAEDNFLMLSEREENTITGLSNSLIGFGTGSMTNHWTNISSITIPILLITGKLDEKFTKINSRINNILPNSTHHIIENSGHNTHLENPQEFFILVSSFLRTFIQ